MRIEILQNRRTNRPNGDGQVYFKSMDEINEAMKYDRKYMGKNSTVCLFLQEKATTTIKRTYFLFSQVIVTSNFILILLVFHPHIIVDVVKALIVLINHPVHHQN